MNTYICSVETIQIWEHIVVDAESEEEAKIQAAWMSHHIQGHQRAVAKVTAVLRNFDDQ